jgi:hypothetical protein
MRKTGQGCGGYCSMRVLAPVKDVAGQRRQGAVTLLTGSAKWPQSYRNDVHGRLVGVLLFLIHFITSAYAAHCLWQQGAKDVDIFILHQPVD